MSQKQIFAAFGLVISFVIIAYTIPWAVFGFWVGAFIERGSSELTLFPRLKEWWDSHNKKPPQGPALP